MPLFTQSCTLRLDVGHVTESASCLGFRVLSPHSRTLQLPDPHLDMEREFLVDFGSGRRVGNVTAPWGSLAFAVGLSVTRHQTSGFSSRQVGS